MTTFHVYELRDPLDNSCFYVGKGNSQRTRLADHIRNARRLVEGKKPADNNPIKAGMIRRMLQEGRQPLFVRVFESESEQEVLAYEIALISQYGRRSNGSGCLANLTAGGEGTFGLKISEEGRANIARASKGRLHSRETRLKMAEIATGRKQSDDTKQKISDFQRGKKRGPRSDEFKQKMREIALNRRHSDETRAKIGAARKGKPWTEARRLSQKVRSK